jgi:diguanylate cyclase (GGDEF)-like protein/PAS domain S-box-containing protein
MSRWPTLNSLRIRLLLSSLVVEAVMLALLVANSARLIQEQLAQLTENRIQAIQLAYGTAVAGPLAERNYPTLQDILAGWQSAEDVSYIAITDRGGRVVGNVGYDPSLPLPAPTSSRDGGDTIHVVFAIEYAGIKYGHVHYGLSTAFLKEARGTLFKQSVLIALLALAATFFLLLAIGYWLTRNLTALTEASTQIAEGNFAVRLDLQGNDEIAAVGQSFNAMASAVQERMLALRESEQRFRAIADYTYAWENWFGPDGKLRWVNPAVERVTGYSARECMAMPDFPLPLVLAQEQALLAGVHEQALVGQSGQDIEFRIRTKDGEVLWMAISWQPIVGESGASLGYRSSIRDITDQHFATEELAYAAAHDTLTGLYNRRAFEQRLTAELARQPTGGVTVFYIDLDQFKLVNDSSGHTAGDALLQELAGVMQSRFSFGFLARLGGDEFGMVLSGIGLDAAQQRAQSIIDDIRALSFEWEGRTFRLGVSIGIAQSSAELRSVTDLLMAADTACYAAKERGRNRAQAYLPSDQYFQQRQLDYLSLTQISDALGAGRLELHGQRIVALRPGLTDHLEVLVRMRGSDGSMILPGRFIPAAERYGLVPLIDRWVIENACRQLQTWQPAGRPLPRLNLNLSGLTLADPGLTDFIQNVFSTHGIAPASIGFEITESCAIAQLDRALNFIDFCREIGCNLALDDFGSGLSSFAYLKRFRVQALKIDGMFVRNADRDADDRAVIESMVRLARLRSLHTVAEFVTSAAVLDVVKSLDVDFAQGYELHIPEPLANLG